MKKIIAGALFGVSLLLPGDVLADAIDGHWCAKGRQLTIDGEKVKTPAKNVITGTYSRHAYSYTIPPKEAGAGDVVDMVMVDENTIHLKQAQDQSKLAAVVSQVWKRCEFTT